MINNDRGKDVKQTLLLIIHQQNGKQSLEGVSRSHASHEQLIGHCWANRLLKVCLGRDGQPSHLHDHCSQKAN